jgi:hypothetical protein
MNRRTSRGAFRILVVSFASAVAFVWLTVMLQSKAPHRDPADWAADAAKNGTLPSTIAELADYPIPFRVAAFQRHSPQVRSRLAREHFTDFRRHNKLSHEQESLIVRFVDALSPDAYTIEGRDAAQRQIAGSCRLITTLFSAEQAVSLGILGPVPPGLDRLRGTIARATRAFFGVANAAASKTRAPCSCASDTECPGCIIFLEICNPGHDGCEETWPGCGCGFIWTCDGGCTPIPRSN